jgi:glycerol-3-phosphate dehydrogenase (NAD(P)+)
LAAAGRWRRFGQRRSVAKACRAAAALEALAARLGVDMPIASTVAAILSGRADIEAAISALLARPLKHKA